MLRAPETPSPTMEDYPEQLKTKVMCDYERALQQYDPLSDEPYVLGNLEEYTSEDLISNEDGDIRCRIFIHNGVVMATSFASKPHEVAALTIGEAVRDSLNSFTGTTEVVFHSTGAIGMDVVNLLGCKSRFAKHPDYSISLRDQFMDCRVDPSIVFEIGFSHENLDLLLNEASVFLNMFTHIE